MKRLANDFRGTTPYNPSNSTACICTAGSRHSPSHGTYSNRLIREGCVTSHYWYRPTQFLSHSHRKATCILAISIEFSLYCLMIKYIKVYRPDSKQKSCFYGMLNLCCIVENITRIVIQRIDSLRVVYNSFTTNVLQSAYRTHIIHVLG